MPERFSASVAGRHMACHASANLPAAIPHWVEPIEDRTANTAANQGSDIHEIFEDIWDLPTARIRQVLKVLEYVAPIMEQRRFKKLIEVPIKATWLVKEPETKADLVLYTQDQLEVIDTKMGKIKVEAYENTQLLYYAVAYSPFAPKAKGVRVHIAQPAINHFDSWWITAARMKKFIDDTIATEAAILAGDVSFGPSDHCTFCPANPHSRGQKGRPFCPAMMGLLYPEVTDDAAVLEL